MPSGWAELNRLKSVGMMYSPFGSKAPTIDLNAYVHTARRVCCDVDRVASSS